MYHIRSPSIIYLCLYIQHISYKMYGLVCFSYQGNPPRTQIYLTMSNLTLGNFDRYDRCNFDKKSGDSLTSLVKRLYSG